MVLQRSWWNSCDWNNYSKKIIQSSNRLGSSYIILLLVATVDMHSEQWMFVYSVVIHVVCSSRPYCYWGCGCIASGVVSFFCTDQALGDSITRLSLKRSDTAHTDSNRNQCYQNNPPSSSHRLPHSYTHIQCLIYMSACLQCPACCRGWGRRLVVELCFSVTVRCVRQHPG